LLSFLGKLLEGIVATRLKTLAIDHDLLAQTQFGFSRKSSTSALRFLLNVVHTGWTPIKPQKRQQTSLLALDIAGAYDNVNQDQLLERLAEKKIPTWIIRFVHSFMSDRSTTLKLPGHESRPFWVTRGIPQGSTLSPILFLFFAAPIIEQFVEELPDTVAFRYTFAYVDDTYLLVSSESHETNNKVLQEMHKRLIDWAEPNGVSFSPGKYAVMHFRRPRSRRGEPPGPPDIPGLDPSANVTELRILGVMIRNDLDWTAHVDLVGLQYSHSSRL
jgi:hypothetical protein